MSISKHNKEALTTILITLYCSICVLFTHGISLGSNQYQYFILSYRIKYASFIENDWFTWNTNHHHFLFGHFFGFLIRHFNESSVIFIITFICYFLFCYAIYLMASNLSPNNKHTVYLYAIIFICLNKLGTDGVGYLYIWHEYLQPSLVSGALLLLSLSLFFCNKLLLSGILLAIGGCFHAGLLISFVPVYTILILFYSKPMIKGIALILLPSFLIIFIYYLRFSLKDSQEVSILSYSIMTQIRAPHHYFPQRWAPSYTLTWLFWCATSIFPMIFIKNRFDKRYIKAYIITFVIMGLSLANALLHFNMTIHYMLMWRCAPIAFYITLLYHCVINNASDTSEKDLPYNLLMVVFSVIWIVFQKHDYYFTNIYSYFIDIIVLTILYMPFFLRFSNKIRESKLNLIIIYLLPNIILYLIERDLVISIMFNWIMLPKISKDMFLFDNFNFPMTEKALFVGVLFVLSLNGFITKGIPMKFQDTTKSDESLYKWVSNNTNPKDIFIIPIDELEGFRIRSKRAIVVDFKSTPYDTKDIIEWYKRLCDITNSDIRQINSLKSLSGNYNLIDSDHAIKNAKKYNAKYIIVKKNEHEGQLTRLRKAYSNDNYSIYELNDYY